MKKAKKFSSPLSSFYFPFFVACVVFFSQRLPGAGRLDVNGVLWGWWGWKRSVGQLIFAQIHRQGRLA
jgi:hypothetical protein